MQTPIDIWLFQIYNLIFAEIFANWSIFLNVIYILMVENVCLQEIYWSQNQLSLCTLKKMLQSITMMSCCGPQQPRLYKIQSVFI